MSGWVAVGPMLTRAYLINPARTGGAAMICLEFAFGNKHNRVRLTVTATETTYIGPHVDLYKNCMSRFRVYCISLSPYILTPIAMWTDATSNLGFARNCSQRTEKNESRSESLKGRALFY
jgi:hypothetical protein